MKFRLGQVNINPRFKAEYDVSDKSLVLFSKLRSLHKKVAESKAFMVKNHFVKFEDYDFTGNEVIFKLLAGVKKYGYINTYVSFPLAWDAENKKLFFRVHSSSFPSCVEFKEIGLNQFVVRSFLIQYISELLEIDISLL